MLTSLRKSSNHKPSGPSTSGIGSSSIERSGYMNRTEDTKRKLAHHIAQRFKIPKYRFKRTLGEHIEECFKTYETNTVDYIN